MSLSSALKSIGGVLGDVAKTAFNAIPLVPNIPPSKFSNPAVAKVSGVLSGVTDIVGNVAANIIPGGQMVKQAANIVSALIPSTANNSKSPSALPLAIPTNGAVQNTLASTLRPIAAPIIAGVTGKAPDSQVPNTIGLFQQTSAAPVATGTKVNVPVNSSGVGLHTQEVPPVAITQTGQIAGSSGLLGAAPASVLAMNPSTLLPTSDPIQKIADVFGKTATTSNTPTNPSTPTQTPSDFGSTMVPRILGFSAAIAFVVWLITRK